MKPAEPVFFVDRTAWRRWLERNHDKVSVIWVLAYKTQTGKRCLSYSDALDEALSYGWIDSRLRRIDDEKHMWRFVPRKPNSIWSLSNRRRVERLIAEGMMTPYGMAKVEAAKRSGEWEKATTPSRPPRIPKDLKDELVENEPAWENFMGFAKSYRTIYIYWVLSAKRQETREKRIKEVARRARRKLKPYMP